MTPFAKLASLLALGLAISIQPNASQAQIAPDPTGQVSPEMMTTLAPMLGMMKKKLGSKRFAELMRTIGPVAVAAMANGGGSIGGGVPAYDATTIGLAASSYQSGMYVAGGNYAVSSAGNWPGMEPMMSDPSIQGMMQMATEAAAGSRKARKRPKPANNPQR